MRRISWLGVVVLSMACGNLPVEVIVDLDPVDAANSIQVFVENNTGEVRVQGEVGRTTVDVQATFNGGVQADYDQVLIVSAADGNAIDVTLNVPSNLPNVVGDLLILVPDTFAANITGNTTLVSVSDLLDGAIIRADAGEVDCQDVTGGISVDSNAVDVNINTTLNVGDTIIVNTEVQGDIVLTLPANTDADFIAASGSAELAIGAELNFVGDITNGVATGIFNAGGNDLTEIDLFTLSGEIIVFAR